MIHSAVLPYARLGFLKHHRRRDTIFRMKGRGKKGTEALREKKGTEALREKKGTEGLRH
jgi:hypothetical protein